MTNLLEVINLSPTYLKRGATPLAMEFPVDPQTAPYLVSSSASLVWVSEAPSSKVRGAVRRDIVPEELFREILLEIALVGKDAQWGNSHPYSLKGVESILDHVRSYNLPDIQLVRSNRCSLLGDLDSHLGCDVVRADWVPEGMVIAIPADRGFVGFIMRLNPSSLISVVHNASRGVGVAWG